MFIIQLQVIASCLITWYKYNWWSKPQSSRQKHKQSTLTKSSGSKRDGKENVQVVRQENSGKAGKAATERVGKVFWGIGGRCEGGERDNTSKEQKKGMSPGDE